MFTESSGMTPDPRACSTTPGGAQGPSRRTAPLIEIKPVYRADTDQGGDWWVWRRLSANGWATHQRCTDQDSARKLAAALNSANPHADGDQFGRLHRRPHDVA